VLKKFVMKKDVRYKARVVASLLLSSSVVSIIENNMNRNPRVRMLTPCVNPASIMRRIVLFIYYHEKI